MEDYPVISTQEPDSDTPEATLTDSQPDEGPCSPEEAPVPSAQPDEDPGAEARPKQFEVISASNTKQLETRLNQLGDAGYVVVSAMTSAGGTVTAIMEHEAYV